MNPELVLFDLETTSAKPQSCAAVQIGVLHILPDGTQTEIYNEICDPGMDCHHEAAEVHGITAEQMIGKRPDYEVLAEFYAWLEARCAGAAGPIIMAGHATTGFDMPILYRIANKPILPVKIIDTLIIARRVLHQCPGDNKLGTLYEWITGTPPVNAHDALGDCKMVLTLIEYLTRALKMDLVQLADYCAEARVLKYCTFGKHKGKLWGVGGKEYVPRHFVRWMCMNFDNPGADLIATVKYHYGMRFRNA